MADSVDSMSFCGTSGKLKDSFCAPCFKDGSVQSAAGYCPKCVEFYCQSCLAAHRRMSVSERHKILIGPDMPACQADKPVKYQRCDKHDGEGKDRYCFDHGITVCGICFIREHKECQVKEVSEACKSFNISAEKTSFGADLGLLLKHVKETSQLIKSNKASLEKKKQCILTEAQELRDTHMEKANQSYQDFIGEVTSKFIDQIITLSARQSELDEIATKVNTILQSLQQIGTKKENEQKDFLELLDYAENFRLCEDKINLFNLKHVDIKCTLNNNIQSLIFLQNRFGELSMQTGPFQYSSVLPTIHYPYTGPRPDPHKTVPGSGAMEGHAVPSINLTPLDRIDVKIPDDKRDCFITGVDITVEGYMFLTDRDNCKVKLFSPNGRFLSSLKPPNRPLDVAVFNKSEAAISMMGEQLGIIGITDSSQLSLKSIIKMKQYVYGITVYNSKLIVTCDFDESHCSVQMIDMRGNVLWTTTTDSEGENLFDYPRILTTRYGDDGDTVIVADEEKKTITVLDAGTGKVIKICDIKGKKPVGVTVDDNGNVYVCYMSRVITVWSRGMQEETRLTTQSKYLKFPIAMAYNSRRSELVLTSSSPDTYYCDFIHRFKISAK